MRNAGFAEMIDFSRPGSATYVGADGLIHTAAADVPRFDYTNGRRQLLLEGPATNLLTYSTGLGGLGSSRCVSTSGYLAPDGSMNAVRSVCTGETDPILERGVSITPSAETQTFSVWLRVVDAVGLKPIVRFYAYGATGLESLTSAVSEELTDEWRRYKFAVKWPEDMVSTTIRWRFDPFDNSMIGDSNSNTPPEGAAIEHWGWQVEEGEHATSYIPTSGSAVTRPAENARLSKPIASLLQRDEMSLLVQGQGFSNGGGRIVGDNLSRRVIGFGPNPGVVYIGNNNAINLGTLTSPLPPFGVAVANSASKNSKHGSLNGDPVVSNSYRIDSAFETVFLGRDGSPFRFAPGWFDQMVIWPFRMSDTDLKRLAVPYA
ncbi:hypothetical protein [Martelella sp. AD-3]|uniref:phage head spike fiber domain-containing protein n=1 Tax=Martelella sp. AD-3 TaxID=686597 RepID=UPI0004661A97|nr:hypothetical protein [Martelella sp. AD-3]AMM84267.1 hypothetical protein AZF01_07745 [Martelella sp. AD-3]